MIKISRHDKLLGHIIKIILSEKTHSYAWVLKYGDAFFGRQYKNSENPAIEEIVKEKIIFRTTIMDYAFKKNSQWKSIGKLDIPKDLLHPPKYFIQDLHSGQISIYQELPKLAPNYIVPATYEEATGLECCAAWDPEQIEDRLRDYFANKNCKWLEALTLYTDDKLKHYREKLEALRNS